jgi:hypothetical protein
MNDTAWFRPKNFGYGATPSNWKGWAFIAAMVLLLQPLRMWLLPGNPLAFVAAVVVWIAVVTAVSRVKCSGPWRWRWRQADSDGR